MLACSCRSQIAAPARRLRARAAPGQRRSSGRRLLCKPRAAGGDRVKAAGCSDSPCVVSQRNLRSRSDSARVPAPPRPRRSRLGAALRPASQACHPRPRRCSLVSCPPVCERLCEFRQNSAFQHQRSLTSRSRAGEPRHSFGDRARQTHAVPRSDRGLWIQGGSAEKPKSRLKKAKKERQI